MAAESAIGGRHQEVKWADGLLHIDGAVTQSWFNDFGTHSPSAVFGSPQGAAVFGWVGGVASRGSYFTLHHYQGCHRAAEWDTDKRELQSRAIKTD